MKSEALELQAALAAAKAQPQALIISLSQVTFGAAPAEPDPTEWIEAHFFGQTQEVRFLTDGGHLTASVLTEEENDRFIDETAKVILPDSATKCIRLRKYVAVDEDGQTYIAAVRLTEEEAV
ncbi:MAG: hypothetical protein ACI4V3_01645 [Faecousia sp.]